ncbi:MAG: hypothetical protein K2H98_05140, partial [Duncaniella sp.]|nr:hypothetical protein [Duncaniella sp.]
MKKLLATMFLLLPMLVGCGHKSKSPVESRFERYIQAKNLSNDIVSIDSIVMIDSITIMNTLERIECMSDSLDKCILAGISSMSDSKHIYNEARAIEAAKIALRYTDIINGDRNKKASDLKDRIIDFIDENNESKCYQLEHKIFVSTHNGNDIYNARTLGYQDTILIYKTEDEDAWTTKSTRIGTYLRDYM